MRYPIASSVLLALSESELAPRGNHAPGKGLPRRLVEENDGNYLDSDNKDRTHHELLHNAILLPIPEQHQQNYEKGAAEKEEVEGGLTPRLC